MKFEFDACIQSIAAFNIKTMNLPWFNFLILQLDDDPTLLIGWNVRVCGGKVADAQIVNWRRFESSKFMNSE